MQNPVLMSSIVAWLIAQILKGVYYFARHRRIDFQRFTGPGGMPSSHSAFVSSLAVGVGIASGFDSTIFALAFGFAIIVMYDASGIRRAAGKQAAVLNEIADELFHGGRIREERLRELLGHTPVEVFAGAALGVAVSMIFMR
jgi:acid phosphatase family membrane protein YuiD